MAPWWHHLSFLQTRVDFQVFVCKIYCDDWIKFKLLQIQDGINFNKLSKFQLKISMTEVFISWSVFFHYSKKEIDVLYLI